jgi:uncharacterized protein YpmB
MMVEPSAIIGILSAMVVAFFQFKLNQQDRLHKEREEELRELREKVNLMSAQSVTENRAREIYIEMMQPYAKGQQEIKDDVKELLAIVHTMQVDMVKNNNGGQ